VTFQAIREKLRPSARPKERPEKIQPDSTVESQQIRPPAAAE